MDLLLSDDLKRKLGNDNDVDSYGQQGIDVVLPSKSKKSKQKKEKKVSKSKQKKDLLKRKKSTERMKSKAEIQHGRNVLLQKISSYQLPESTSLLSSKTLMRKQPKVRLPWDISGNEEEGEEEWEEEEEEEVVIVRRRVEPFPFNEFKELKQREIEVPKELEVGKEDDAAVVWKRADPERKARVLESRPQEFIESRKELPASQWEGQIMDVLSDNDIVIVCGPTGSGKTTQIPQWVYEHGYRDLGLICVTQPRKVAARMVSERVASEMGVVHGKDVGYHVRHECVVEDYEKCDIVFMTDGLLLSFTLEDVLLSRYSVIIIDEAHERTLGTDVLLGMLSRVVPLRRRRWLEGGDTPPLKVIIMSATLSIEQLTTGLFKSIPPVVSIEGRQFPVETHWLRVTPSDLINALEEAVKHVSLIHRTLPQGTVLVFVPGKREIFFVIRKLEALFAEKEKGLHLIPLHSGLDLRAQRLAFQSPPAGKRMVVVSTNVAECSLTLPNVRYVVDTGFSRERVWTSDGDGVFATKRISQASASQRTGRAGRTMGGHCYRLYSQPFFHHHMDEHELPQSLKLPCEQLVLTLVTIGISYPARFPLPSPPSANSLTEAQLRLAQLGLLRSEMPPLKQTVLGFSASALPVEPACARALLGLGNDWGCFEALAMATWAHGHSLWVADREGTWTVTWKEVVSICDIMLACNAFYEMCKHPENAQAIRAALGMPSTAVQAVFSLADQLMHRSDKSGHVSSLLAAAKPPDLNLLLTLRQALLGGVPQFVMRKEGNHYVRLLDNSKCYLHPVNCSKEFKAANHPWIACLELQSPNESSKRYAVYPFAINPAWLHDVVQEGPELHAPKLVDFSRLDLSSVKYDAENDMLTVECSPRYGPLIASLPNVTLSPHKDPKSFAILLLEGSVYESLAVLEKSLLVPARTSFASDSLLTPAQLEFLKVLGNSSSKSELEQNIQSWEHLARAAVPLYVPAARKVAFGAWKNVHHHAQQSKPKK